MFLFRLLCVFAPILPISISAQSWSVHAGAIYGKIGEDGSFFKHDDQLDKQFTLEAGITRSIGFKNDKWKGHIGLNYAQIGAKSGFGTQENEYRIHGLELETGVSYDLTEKLSLRGDLVTRYNFIGRFRGDNISDNPAHDLTDIQFGLALSLNWNFGDHLYAAFGIKQFVNPAIEYRVFQNNIDLYSSNAFLRIGFRF